MRTKPLRPPVSNSVLLAAVTSLLVTGAHAGTWTSTDGGNAGLPLWSANSLLNGHDANTK